MTKLAENEREREMGLVLDESQREEKVSLESFVSFFQRQIKPRTQKTN